MNTEKITFTQIDNDTNGNPRYVCHFLAIPLTPEEQLKEVSDKYDIALSKARQLGGRKYHTKKYGGGIVFQSYNIRELEKDILKLAAPSTYPVKSADLKRLAGEYILSNIDGADYDKVLTTDVEKLEFLAETFKSAKKWEIERIGENRAFIDWLQGIPSAYHVDFENYKILLIAKKWGSIREDATEKEEQKILDNWFNFIANKTFQLLKKYKIDY